MNIKTPNNIVIIADWTGFKHRPDKLDYNFFTYIKSNSKFKVILCQLEKNEIKETIKKNDIIIVFTCTPNIKTYNNKKIYYIYDLCCRCACGGCDGTRDNCLYKNQQHYINEQKFDYIWYKYETPITKRLSSLNSNYFKFPHMMYNTKNIDKYFKLKKKYDILFYGATYPKMYPFRNRLYYILKKNEKNINIKFLPWSKRHPEKMIIGTELNKFISESWLSCATCAQNNSLVSKYFEIPLHGSVILGNYPEYESEQYIKQNMIYINKSMTDEDILNCITEALKNKKKLQQYSENLRKYLLENYTYDNGLKKFEELISYALC